MKNTAHAADVSAAIDAIRNEETERMLRMATPPNWAFENPYFRRDWAQRHPLRARIRALKNWLATRGQHVT